MWWDLAFDWQLMGTYLIMKKSFSSDTSDRQYQHQKQSYTIDYSGTYTYMGNEMH